MLSLEIGMASFEGSVGVASSFALKPDCVIRREEQITNCTELEGTVNHASGTEGIGIG